jgi:hypothetical protein
LVDVGATIAAIAGASLEGRGHDLRDAGLSSTVLIQAAGAPFLTEANGPLAKRDCRAVIEGRYKLAQHGEAIALFDLSSDPLEAHDLSSAMPELAERLKRELPDRIRASATDRSIDQPMSPEERRALKQLGYTDGGH